MSNQSPDYFDHFLIAGNLAKEVRSYGQSLIVPGASYHEVREKIAKKIGQLGAIAAFPPQISLNHVAAHYLAWPDEEIVFSDQLVKLDVGVCYRGAIGDCAVTVDLSGKYQHFIDAAEAALKAAEQTVEVGVKISEIGRVIAETISSYRLKPIKNLSGHGLGYYQVHTSPLIGNYQTRCQEKIRPGMTFAIEPFVTDGFGLIYEDKNPTIFTLQSSYSYKPTSAATCALLTKMETFQGLPFAIHDLMNEDFSLEQVKETLQELMRVKAVAGYPPLIEQRNGMVAQAENSVLVDHAGKVTITTR